MTAEPPQSDQPGRPADQPAVGHRLLHVQVHGNTTMAYGGLLWISASRRRATCVVLILGLVIGLAVFALWLLPNIEFEIGPVSVSRTGE